ncbi:DUF5996 family protein [Variovorax ureilyticus]|uniref:DUF5996 family protein n=1 Tax=Variovorax ureilyticus TaxID=1836198 RepID=UPI003BF4DCEA
MPGPVTREAYSHEVSSAGIRPGNEVYPSAAFFSYAYPTHPDSSRPLLDRARPSSAKRSANGCCLSDGVRTAADPDAVVLDFLSGSYRAASDLAGWDRGRDCGMAWRPRRGRFTARRLSRHLDSNGLLQIKEAMPWPR